MLALNYCVSFSGRWWPRL